MQRRRIGLTQRWATERNDRNGTDFVFSGVLDWRVAYSTPLIIFQSSDKLATHNADSCSSLKRKHLTQSQIMVSYRYLYTWLSGDVDFCIYYHADHEECLLHAKNHFHKLEACKSLIIDVVNNSPLDPSGQPLAIYSRNEQGYEFYKTYES